MDNKNKKPCLLVIASKEMEDWEKICSNYKEKFNIYQSAWDEILLTSYSDCERPQVTLRDSKNKKTQSIQPDLVLIRNLAHSIGSRLGNNPDYRNILYGFYHSNTPLINGLNALIAELEKPIMYGRLRYIRDKVGEKEFPLIKQYYYPEYCQMAITPSAPFVLKVGFPHAGYGKIRVFDYHQFEDLASIVAVNNTYSSTEPLIDVDYELRIVFIAPNYYRVHKRMSMGWKVNFGMTNIREDVEMNSRWKKWVDLIFQNYPDMLTFDIDAIVDKNGNEYILEVNGSSQGFSPEHEKEDLNHMKNMVIMKIEEISGNNNILEKDKRTPELENLFIHNKNDIQVQKSDDKDIEIINLKNNIEHLKNELDYINNEYQYLISKKNLNFEKSGNFNFKFYIFFGLIIVLIISLIINIKK
jgi:hypothetical protein